MVNLQTIRFHKKLLEESDRLCSVKSPYFEMIRDGQKKVEGRINKDKWSRYQVGDRLMLTRNKESNCVNDFVCVEITEIVYDSNFRDLCFAVGVNNILPDYIGEHPESVYDSIYTNKDEIRDYGVVGLYFKVVIDHVND